MARPGLYVRGYIYLTWALKMGLSSGEMRRAVTAALCSYPLSSRRSVNVEFSPPLVLIASTNWQCHRWEFPRTCYYRCRWLVSCVTSPFVQRQSRNTPQPYQIDPAAEFIQSGRGAETHWEREHLPLLVSMWGRVDVTRQSARNSLQGMLGCYHSVICNRIRKEIYGTRICHNRRAHCCTSLLEYSVSLPRSLNFGSAIHAVLPRCVTF
jgi:hypothetical protein